MDETRNEDDTGCEGGESSLLRLWEQTLLGESDEGLREALRKVKTETDGFALPKHLLADIADDDERVAFEAITSLSIPQRIKLALYGNKFCRSVLIKDRYRPIPLFVLENPQLTAGEVQDFAKSTSIDQTVLRAIANNATWTKNYALRLAIVSNPKTPVDIGLRFLPLLTDNDLKRLSKSKNIPQVLAVQCRKLLEQRKRN